MSPLRIGRWVASGLIVTLVACSQEPPVDEGATGTGEASAASAEAASTQAAATSEMAAASSDATLLMRASDFSSASVVHFEVTGVVTDPHVQLPSDDADQYGDVVEKVTLSFDWDTRSKSFVGAPEFQNYPASVSNLAGMEAGCPAGELKGPYEHFDIVELKPNGAGAIELVGVRKHPETAVAESCGAGRRTYPAASRPRTEWIAPPDLRVLQIAALVPTQTGIKFTPDGKSIVSTALNNNWVWTYTPSVK